MGNFIYNTGCVYCLNKGKYAAECHNRNSITCFSLPIETTNAINYIQP